MFPLCDKLLNVPFTNALTYLLIYSLMFNVSERDVTFESHFSENYID